MTRLSAIAALAATLLVLVGPCLCSASAATHDCCTAATAIAAPSPDCCAGAPRPEAVAKATVGVCAPGPAVAELAQAAPIREIGTLRPLLAPSSPPTVLRI